MQERMDIAKKRLEPRSGEEAVRDLLRCKILAASGKKSEDGWACPAPRASTTRLRSTSKLRCASD